MRVSSPIFVGRVAERAALTSALERAAEGQPGIVVISGEAGVGKSRFLAECTALARSMGIASASGACLDAAAAALPFGPFVDVLQGLHRAGLTAGLGPPTLRELGRLAPALSPGGEQPDPGVGGQGRLFAAVRDAIMASSAGTPVLLTIEDLHWADASTLDLVKYVARSMEAEHCLLVLTARLDNLSRRHPLHGVIAELARLPRLERIELRRFDEGEMAQQLTGILGRAPDVETARGIFERSDGNAFFAEELMASGAGRGGTLPTSLRDVLSARLTALDDTTQRMLRVAAVGGPVVRHDLLEQVAGIAAPALLDALREAVEEGVLVSTGDVTPAYAFRHALVREAAYDDLLATERVALHRAYAAVLERAAAGASGEGQDRSGEIAYHAMAAHDLPRALSASMHAAVVAEEASAFAEAELQLERITEIWPRIDDASARVGMDEPGLLVRLARAAGSAGRPARAVKAAGAALALLDAADVDRRAAVLLELFDYAWEAADIDAAERALDEALSILGDERTPRGAQARASLSYLHFHRGRYTAAAQTISRAIEIARACDAQRELVLALTIQGQALTQLGETNRAEASFGESVALLDDVADPVIRARALRYRGWARFMHGEFEEALALNRQALEIARREGADARVGVHILDAVLECLIELGRWDEAAATAALIFARLTVSFEFIYSHASLARMYTLQGRLVEAEQEIAQAAGISTDGPHRVWQLEDQIRLAYASGRHAEGRALMDSAIEGSYEPEGSATLWYSLVRAVRGEADRAEAARLRRRRAEADDAVIAGRRFADLFRRSAARAVAADGGGPLVAAELALLNAEEARLLGNADPVLWSTAVEARGRTAQPWELAYVRFRLGEALLADGRPAAEAAEPLRQAVAVARELGAAPLAVSIEALASRARIVLDDRQAVSEPQESQPVLTARELGVLALVAAGHTNREIGDRLYISEKTASVHVTRAMGKLGALSRYEAAAAATRLGLLEPATESGAQPRDAGRL